MEPLKPEVKASEPVKLPANQPLKIASATLAVLGTTFLVVPVPPWNFVVSGVLGLASVITAAFAGAEVDERALAQIAAKVGEVASKKP